jgi:hypothetical protein
MAWDKERILKELKRLAKKGETLSYNAMAAKNQSLVSAAAYHFGSYRKAIEHAGLDYADVLRRPRWSKQNIIQLIKDAKRKGIDLHWAAVTKRRDELGKAAFAAIQPRLFSSWDRALHAAGLDADDVSIYRTWDKASVAFDLRARASDGEAMNSGALQKDDPGLHAAAMRYFGSYDAALRAAKLDPAKYRERRRWTKPEVIAALKFAKRSHKTINDSVLRKNHPALYGAIVRTFGNVKAAMKAAKI